MLNATDIKHPRTFDTWLYMMLTNIKSEHGGAFQLISESLMPVTPRAPTGHQGSRVQVGLMLKDPLHRQPYHCPIALNAKLIGIYVA